MAASPRRHVANLVAVLHVKQKSLHKSCVRSIYVFCASLIRRASEAHLIESVGGTQASEMRRKARRGDQALHGRPQACMHGGVRVCVQRERESEGE